MNDTPDYILIEDQVSRTKSICRLNDIREIMLDNTGRTSCISIEYQSGRNGTTLFYDDEALAATKFKKIQDYLETQHVIAVI